MEINNTFTSLIAGLPYPNNKNTTKQSEETKTNEKLEELNKKSFEDVQKSLENKSNDDSKNSVNISV